MNLHEIKSIVEALIFVSQEPLTAEKIIEILSNDVCPEEIDLIIKELNNEYKKNNKKFKIVKAAGGFITKTTEDVDSFIIKLLHNKGKISLSNAALEVLSIIIFKQPITRSEISKLRGTNSDGIVSNLLDKKLVKIVGKSKELNRALLIGTDKNLLIKLGLDSLEDIPNLKELREMLEKSAETSSKKDLEEDENG